MTQKSYLPYAILTAVILLASYLIGASVSKVNAMAPSGLPASIATTSPAAVSTTASTIFATSTCAARIISTTASPVMLTFSENQSVVPTALFGVLQAASTTVAYDSGQYGCGAVQVYAFVAGNITVSESR